MFKTSKLTKKRIANGVYEGVYEGKTEPALELYYLGKAVGEAKVTPINEQENSWLIQCTIPVDTLSDGIQTFLVCHADKTVPLDSFSIITGEPLDDDLRNEISLLREELDMLKRAFRRHCVETMG
ncbi:MAG: hypothetical protein QM492_10335 [Rhodobacterales bacterium]